MSPFPEVNADSFYNQVLQSPLPVLLEFSAPWCAPCKRLDPILEQLVQEWEGRIGAARVNVDESSELAMQYHVMSVPTVILIKGGIEAARLTGLQSREKLVERFSPYL